MGWAARAHPVAHEALDDRCPRRAGPRTRWCPPARRPAAVPGRVEGAARRGHLEPGPPRRRRSGRCPGVPGAVGDRCHAVGAALAAEPRDRGAAPRDLDPTGRARARAHGVPRSEALRRRARGTAEQAVPGAVRPRGPAAVHGRRPHRRRSRPGPDPPSARGEPAVRHPHRCHDGRGRRSGFRRPEHESRHVGAARGDRAVAPGAGDASGGPAARDRPGSGRPGAGGAAVPAAQAERVGAGTPRRRDRQAAARLRGGRASVPLDRRAGRGRPAARPRAPRPRMGHRALPEGVLDDTAAVAHEVRRIIDRRRRDLAA